MLWTRMFWWTTKGQWTTFREFSPQFPTWPCLPSTAGPTSKDPPRLDQRSTVPCDWLVLVSVCSDWSIYLVLHHQASLNAGYCTMGNVFPGFLRIHELSISYLIFDIDILLTPRAQLSAPKLIPIVKWIGLAARKLQMSQIQYLSEKISWYLDYWGSSWKRDRKLS